LDCPGIAQSGASSETLAPNTNRHITIFNAVRRRLILIMTSHIDAWGALE
jgi:hypothetical protein